MIHHRLFSLRGVCGKPAAAGKQRGVVAVLLLAALLAAGALPSWAQRYPGKSWQRIEKPEELGWSSEKLQQAEAYSKTIATAAVMIVTDGRILYQWGDTARKYRCHSIRKSFLSALYGIHVAQGTLDLGKTMAELGIDDNPPPLTATEKRAKVSDLIKARSGIYHPALYETNAMKAMRPARGSHAPGTFWYYNNWDFNALGTIFEQETGTKIFAEFKRRIADPIGMEDYTPEDGRYFTGPDSVHPAYPFRMSSRDMARFGLLFLRNGKWGEKQVVPAAWAQESTASYSDAGEGGGYGYMWWVAAGGKHLPGATLPDGSYSARGAGGHYILVIPAEDLVIVHRVNTDRRGRRVSSEEFGELVKRIRDARREND